VLAGVRWYADPANSVVDPQRRRQHEQSMKPLHDLMRLVSAAADHVIDGFVPGDPDCARANLEAWAAHRAILSRPTWSVPLAEQTIAVAGLNLAALKFERAGRPLSGAARTWIGEATRVIVDTYRANTQRGNLYAWSGVAAAANDLLTGSPAFETYSSAVWRDGLAAIRADGYVEAELERKARALIYHNYLRSALVLLDRLRSQAGNSATPAELEALARLEAVVNAGACNDKLIATLAGARQEPLGRWEFSIGGYLGEARFNPDWARCTRGQSDLSGVTYGGRFDLTDRVLRRPTP